MSAIRDEPNPSRPSVHERREDRPARPRTLLHLTLVGLVVGVLALGYGTHFSPLTPHGAAATGLVAAVSTQGSPTAVTLLDDSNGSGDDGGGGGISPPPNATGNSSESNGTSGTGSSGGGDGANGSLSSDPPGANGASPTGASASPLGPLNSVSSLSIGDAAFLGFAALMGVGVVLTVVRARRGARRPPASSAAPPPKRDLRPAGPEARR